jgi:hypothetical protein
VTTATSGIQLRPGGQRGWPPAAVGQSGIVACLVYRAGCRAAVRGRLFLTGGVRITKPIEDSTARLAARTTAVSTGSPVLGRLLAAARRARACGSLAIKERLLRAWLACKRLTGLSFPRRFPIVQFPNLPLIVAVLAGAAGKFLDGSAHSYAASVSYLAMTIWAYEELVHGVNWFRRLLGLAYVILLVVRVAGALHP